jgi:pimeloyl-ACP methyl ester carboxylesterase
VKSFAKYVKDFITFKGLDRVILLGNSLGGHIVCTILRCIQKSSGFIITAQGYTRVPWETVKEVIMNTSRKKLKMYFMIQ